jgi:hypothetical protein
MGGLWSLSPLLREEIARNGLGLRGAVVPIFPAAAW